MGVPAPHRIEWNLLHNAIDFIRYGVELFFAADSTNGGPPAIFAGTRPRERPDHAYKHAILNLHAGCLLLLKERLRQAHEAFVYHDIDRAGASLKKKGGGSRKPIRTVDFDQAMNRLENWAGVSLGADEKKTLRWLQTKRNEVEHFKFSLFRKEAEKHVSATVEFAYIFLRDELEVELEDELSRDAWRHVSALREIAKRIAKEKLDRLLAFGEHVKGLSLTELEKFSEVEAYHPKHNPDPVDPMECQACGDFSVYPAYSDDPLEAGTLVCTNPECREVCWAHSCSRCGAQTSGAEWCDQCEADFVRVLEKD